MGFTGGIIRVSSTSITEMTKAKHPMTASHPCKAQRLAQSGNVRKFYTAQGWLTMYSLACGYIESAESKGVNVTLWHEGGIVFHVRAHDHNGRGRLFWESYESLPAARSKWNEFRKAYGLKVAL